MENVNIGKRGISLKNDTGSKNVKMKYKAQILKIIFTAFVWLLGFSSVMPFLWMISASFKIPADVLKLPIEWIPRYFYAKNYMIVWNIGDYAPRDYHFALSYLNSIKITLTCLFGALITSSLAGYAFAKIRFRYANAIFLLYLSTMMIPGQVTLIPKFVMFDWMGIIGTHWTLILPGIITPTGTFLMRQFFIQIPNELREAAHIDGASELRTFLQIMLPLAKPALASLGTIIFMWHWNDYQGPLVFLQNWRTYTIPISLNNFVDENTAEYNLIMAASVSSMLPIFIIFLAGQKYFVKGLTAGAVKG